MRQRFRAVDVARAVVVAAIVVVPLRAAQPSSAAATTNTTRVVKSSSRWTMPRTPWGDPDLQGLWPSIDLQGTPYERPPELAGKAYMGDSRGRWEGDTLVIETTNFNGKVGLTRNGNTAPTSTDLRLVERLTRTDADTIHYEATVSDPRIWVRPWKVALPLRRHSEYGMFEYACHEGNYAMPNILSGARSDEKPAR